MNDFRRKPKRTDLKQGEIPCDYCSAKCCKYFALPIETPTTFEDFQYIRWYLLHDAAYIFVEDGTWYLLVQTECKHLRPDNRCGIYATRPAICSEYNTDDCEYDDDWTYERYFETAEQVQEFCEAVFCRPGDADFRSPRPTLFPVIDLPPQPPATQPTKPLLPVAALSGDGVQSPPASDGLLT